MLVTNKMNSKRQQIKNVNRFGASVTVCVFALTVGAAILLSVPTVEAAGQVIGGYTFGNQAVDDGSVVVGGGKDKEPNFAEGENSVVVGGTKNAAEGAYTTIVGGLQNIVHEEIKNGAILGGKKNQIEAVGTLVGNYATISGGEDNIAYGESSSISGGNANGTYGLHSSIAGGRGNNAGGEIGSVIGGSQNNADGHGSTLAGGLGNTGVGMWSSVFGGSKNEAVGTGASILGGGGREFTGRKFITHKNIANGEYSTIVGSRDARTVANGSTVLGGSNGLTLGVASTSIGGGFTGDKAENSVALGHKAGTTVKYGTAIGHESVATEEGTIAFGHDAGDVSGYTVKYPDKEITTHLGYKKTVPDYDKEPTVTPTTYTDAKYNRLVKVADGVDEHDVVTVGQLKSSTGQLESTVGQLESTVGQLQAVGTNLDTKVNKATASSYALAALHPNFSGDETGLGVAVGFGHFHGKTATALGAFYRPSRNVQLNVGTVLGNGNSGFNGGLSFKVGSESKGTSTSTDARIAELERRILELEQAKK
jgi:hep/hag repeat protein